MGLSGWDLDSRPNPRHAIRRLDIDAANRILLAADEKAGLFVNEHTNEIRTVAAELEVRRSLTGQEVVDLIMVACDSA